MLRNGARQLLGRISLTSRQSHNSPVTKLNPALHGFTAELAKKQPCFKVSPMDVHILSEPHQFYKRLLVCYRRVETDVLSLTQSYLQDMIRRARKRIFISSLYIGSSDRELACIRILAVLRCD